MRKIPPFYSLFAVLKDGAPQSANCKCPAGESHVHIAALLITLSEIPPQACTSMRSAWSRPSQGGKALLATDLDFGKASMDGYVVYDGLVQPITGLLELLEGTENVGALDFSRQESQQRLHATPLPSCNPVLIDPLDKLAEIAASCEVNVCDLIDALQPTHEEVHLIQEMSIGQRNNPLWFDAHQWRITSSNFGKVCN